MLNSFGVRGDFTPINGCADAPGVVTDSKETVVFGPVSCFFKRTVGYVCIIL